MPSFLNQMVTHFNLSELQTLCYELNILYDEIAGDTLSDKARELIFYCQRHNKIQELLTQCNQLRPHVSWNRKSLERPEQEQETKRKFFVGHAYDKKQIDDLRDAIKRATTGTAWQPVYADEQGISSHMLSDKIASLIAESEFCLFEISNQARSNFFIELDIALQHGKPVYLMLDKNAPPPSDFEGQALIIYESYRELTNRLKQQFFSRNLTRLLRKYSRHTYHVNSISVRHDQSLIASGSGDQTAILWDLHAKQVKATLKHDSWVGAVAFAPTDPYLTTSDGKGTIRLWDIHQGKLIATQSAHQDPRRTVAFLADGSFLASGGGDQKIVLWRVPGLERALTLEGHGAEVRRVAFSPDSRKLVSCGADGKCLLWSIEEGIFDILLDTPQNLLRSVSYAPDGKTIAAMGSDGLLRIWQEIGLNQWQRQEIQAHEGPAGGLAFHPLSKIVATGGQDKQIHLWAIETKKRLRTIQGHGDSVTCLAFTPNGKWLLSGSRDRTVCLWEI